MNDMKPWLVLPILIPLTTAAVCFLLFRFRAAQRACSVLGSAALLGVSLKLLHLVWRDGIQTTQMGGWPSPFGISLVADLFSAILVSVAGVIALAIALYSLADVDHAREAFHYYSLLNLLLAGICGAFLTGDIFNLYVWFEVLLIASFVLLALGGERPQMKGALRYVAINLFSSALFLAAVGILYGLTGTLNLADLSTKLAVPADGHPVDGETGVPRGLITTVAMMFLVAFAVKAALFPFFFWLPASYPAPPVAISAIFAGLLTEVGVYALGRTFTLLFVQETGFTHGLILALAGITMLVGVLGAIAQAELRRMLSFLIISHVGVMLAGLGLFTPLAVSGLVFYIMHHTIAQATVFLIAGVAYRICGTTELKGMGGLYASHPALALLFAVPALALAAFSRFCGFYPTVGLLRAGLEAGQFLVVGAIVVTDFLTLYVVARIWAEVFWKPRPEPEPDRSGKASVESPETIPVLRWTLPSEDRLPTRPDARTWLFIAPIAVLTTASAGIAVAAGGLFTLARAAAEQLLDRSKYIQAVLGAP